MASKPDLTFSDDLPEDTKDELKAIIKNLADIDSLKAEYDALQQAHNSATTPK